MSANSEERFYKRKINEFDQELKRLQRELQKLKVLKRNGGRARKQIQRSLQREMDLQDVFETMQTEEFEEIQVQPRKSQCEYMCKECRSGEVQLVTAGLRTIVVCQDCKSRYTVVNDLAKTA